MEPQSQYQIPPEGHLTQRQVSIRIHSEKPPQKSNLPYLLIFLIGIYLLNLIGSLVLMILNPDTRMFSREPLRLIVLAILFFATSLFWVVLLKYRPNGQFSSLRLEYSYFALAVGYSVIQTEIASAYGDDLEAPPNIGHVATLQSLVFGIAFIFCSSLPLIKCGLLLIPFVYSCFRLTLIISQPTCYTIIIMKLILIFWLLYSYKRIESKESCRGPALRYTKSLPLSRTKSKSQFEHDLTIQIVNEKIAKQETSNNHLLNLLPDGILIVNRSKEVVYVNDSLPKLLQCEKEDVVVQFLALSNKDVLDVEKNAADQKNYRKVQSEALKLKINAEFSPLFDLTQKKWKNKSKDKIPNLDVKNQEELQRSSQISSIAEVSESINLTATKKKPGSNNNASSGNKLLTEYKDETPPITRRNSFDNKSVLSERMAFAKRYSPEKLHAHAHPHPEDKTPDKSLLMQQLLQHSLKNSFLSQAENKKQEFEKFQSSEKAADYQARNYRNKIDRIMEKFFNKTRLSKKRNANEIITMLLKKLSPLFHHEQQNDSSKIIAPYRHTATTRFDEEFIITTDLTVGTSHALTMNSLVKVSDKKAMLLETKFCPVIIEGELSIVCVIRDITDRDVAMRLQELDKQKDESLAAITHEFRSPLNGILSMLESLKLHISKELQMNYLEPATASTKSLLNLVNDILDMYQIHAKQLRLVFTPCIVEDILNNCINILKFAAVMKGLQLFLEIDEKVPKTIVTDPNRLQQIILNLISNSLKFTQKGGIYIKVTKEALGKIKISVRDTGVGISSSDLPKLFKRFGKLDLREDNIMNPQGAGLGLSISHGLAQRLNTTPNEGGLNVESKVGEGTEFWFIIDDLSVLGENAMTYENEVNEVAKRVRSLKRKTTKKLSPLPSIRTKSNPKSEIHDVEDDSDVEKEKIRSFYCFQNTLTPPLLKKECHCSKILITDDDGFQVWAIQSLLKNLGIKDIDHAFSGEEAIQKFEKALAADSKCCPAGYTLIFMDCEMPGKNGLATTSEIIGITQKANKPRPVIIGVTGHSSSSQSLKCVQAGMTNVFTKPIFQKELEEYLKAINLL